MRPFRIASILLILISGASSVLQAQGVAINTSGVKADTSAALDISSTSKGMLVPRLTAAERTAIILPATGLIVYQTDDTPGFCYNSGTPVSPNWVKIIGGGDNLGNHTAMQNINLNGHWLSPDGSDKGVWVNTAGNIGIGESNPAYTLDVKAATGDAVVSIGSSSPSGPGGPVPRLRFVSGVGTWQIYTTTSPGGINSLILATQDGPKLILGATDGSLSQGQYSPYTIGQNSTKLGAASWASGVGSFAAGYATKASGDYSTAMGRSTIASGVGSTTFGTNTQAIGVNSTAIGAGAVAQGDESIAIAYGIATGLLSIAVGDGAIASGHHSMAFGRNVSTNDKVGGFVMGDAIGIQAINTLANQMVMRFDGGYKLFSNGDTSTGVYMNSGVSGWTNISDRNRKENFQPVEGESILNKIRQLPITEWNYKNANPDVRYIGPVAQDFYAAFQLGGADSLGINSICIDGVNMAAIQALEKRTRELKTVTAELATALDELQAMKKELVQLRALKTRIEDLEARMAPTKVPLAVEK